MVAVRIKCQRHCEFGEALKVVGANPEVGEWQVEAAPTLEWSEGDVWTVDLKIPAESELTFKFVVDKGNGNVVWEAGGDRVCAKLEQSVVLDCGFNDTSNGCSLVPIEGATSEEEVSAVPEEPEKEEEVPPPPQVEASTAASMVAAVSEQSEGDEPMVDAPSPSVGGGVTSVAELPSQEAVTEAVIEAASETADDTAPAKLPKAPKAPRTGRRSAARASA